MGDGLRRHGQRLLPGSAATIIQRSRSPFPFTARAILASSCSTAPPRDTPKGARRPIVRPTRRRANTTNGTRGLTLFISTARSLVDALTTPRNRSGRAPMSLVRPPTPCPKPPRAFMRPLRLIGNKPGVLIERSSTRGQRSDQRAPRTAGPDDATRDSPKPARGPSVKEGGALHKERADRPCTFGRPSHRTGSDSAGGGSEMQSSRSERPLDNWLHGNGVLTLDDR